MHFGFDFDIHNRPLNYRLLSPRWSPINLKFVKKSLKNLLILILLIDGTIFIDKH